MPLYMCPGASSLPFPLSLQIWPDLTRPLVKEACPEENFPTRGRNGTAGRHAGGFQCVCSRGRVLDVNAEHIC